MNTNKHLEQIHALNIAFSATEQQLTEEITALSERKQEIAVQLLTVQQQAEQQRAELILSHSEQESALRLEHAEREQTLQEKLQALQEQLNRLQQERAEREKLLHEQNCQSRQVLESQLRTQVQREQQVATQLLKAQQQAEQEKTELAHRHEEYSSALQREYAEREQTLRQQLHDEQIELHRLQEDWTRHESALNREIAILQIEMQALSHMQQLQLQQHGFELSARQDEHHRLVQTHAALEAQLKAEILAEQQTNVRLRQVLAEMQRALETTQASLTWRLTGPVRKFALLIPWRRNLDPASIHLSEPELPDLLSIPTVAHPPQPNFQQATVKPFSMLSISAISPNIPAIAATLEEVLACHDLHFIHSAYQTLLGREPDPDGLKYYKKRLDAGYAKIGVLKQINESAEGKLRASTVLGLDSAIKKYKLGQIPVLGWFFRILNPSFVSDCEMQRNLRTIERQLNELNQKYMQRFDKLEKFLHNPSSNDDSQIEAQEQFSFNDGTSHIGTTQNFQAYADMRQKYSEKDAESNSAKTPLENFSRKINRIEK